MKALPASNCKVLKIERVSAAVVAADDWSAAEIDDPTTAIVFEGRADGNLYQADSITSSGNEVTIVAVRKLILPAVAELELGDIATVEQRGVTGLRGYRITSLGLDSSELQGGAVYSCTVQQVA
jgi:hypothetical protein